MCDVNLYVLLRLDVDCVACGDCMLFSVYTCPYVRIETCLCFIFVYVYLYLVFCYPNIKDSWQGIYVSVCLVYGTIYVAVDVDVHIRVIYVY